MTNNDNGFEQRWEFRRREVDGDTSSDDNRSNSCGDPTDMNHHKLATDLALLENDDDDAPGCQRRDDTYSIIHSPVVKAESPKEKKVVQKKSGGRLNVKEKRKTKFNTNEMVMLKDLKIFGDSLIRELAVAQENMFAHMRAEMRKLATSRPSLLPSRKNVGRSHKKKVCPKNGVEAGVKPQNCSIITNVASDHGRKFAKAVAETREHETRVNELQPRLPSMVHMNLAYGSDHLVVSSSHLPPPTIVPKPQFLDQRNRFHLNDHIPSIAHMNNSGLEIKERFGSFCRKGVALLGQNSSQGIGFPVPLNQGADNGSNMSSLTYCENSIMDSNGVGLRMNGSIGRFLGRNPMSSERALGDSITSKTARKTDGEFVAERLQDLKDGQFYRTSLRNDR